MCGNRKEFSFENDPETFESSNVLKHDDTSRDSFNYVELLQCKSRPLRRNASTECRPYDCRRDKVANLSESESAGVALSLKILSGSQ